ncbi:ParA family protein [Halalkalibacterium halodurans]|uniref:ParA family protein n=1 Tax=Halalkalibacterium halodurans TaxID=86665 RepID=UPI0010687335|nr:ParA family protein [Halalkalibacterium halodurans]TES47194.1 ParA family protein [Halalkalibacterium halodurans]
MNAAAKVINVANFKGGVGKTTTTVLLSYLLAQRGERVLVLDLDPQANATDLLARTANLERLDTTLYQAMADKNLTKAIVKIKENLDLLPSDLDLVAFPFLLNKEAKDDNYKRAYFVDFLLAPLKSTYDYIFIDVPPTISDFTNNAVVSSDFVMIVMQTHERSLSASEKFIPYLQDMIDNYHAKIDLIGIVPVLMKKDGTVDNFIISEAEKLFEEDLFKAHISIRERIKRFDVNGITEEDHHDLKVLGMYNNVLDEMLMRIKKLEGVEV